MIRLQCPVQNYAWGRLRRDDSEVAKLVAAAGGEVDHSQPYAELWMGSHPSGPATLANAPDTTLSSWLDNNRSALGSVTQERFGIDLPFLFKVLSVQTALSIQSHPDKKLAEKLHAERPKDYKDDNHKPEMAIAITDFEALCGFVPTAELQEAVASTPELRDCIGAELAHDLMQQDQQADSKTTLKQAFSALMTCPTEKVKSAIDALDRRLLQEKGRPLTKKEHLVLRLHAQYPNDVGVLSAFFLNLVELKADQAIYLAANVPHAYVSGQLIECMATSDNVVRAGLTPKLRDTEVLCESLTYEQGPPEVLHGEPTGQYMRSYRPPFEEFEVSRLELPKACSTALPGNQGPTVVLVQQGSGSSQAASMRSWPHAESFLPLSKGDVFFVPADTALQLKSSDSERLLLWIASVNSSVFESSLPKPVYVNGVLANGTSKRQRVEA